MMHNSNDVAVAFFTMLGKIGVAYIVGACLCGADCLIPHKYVYVKDGKTYYTNRKPN